MKIRRTIKVGTVFHYLTTTSDVYRKNKASYVDVICKCEKINSCKVSHLIEGRTRSCGCLLSEWTSNRNKTHGLGSHLLYGVWGGMKRRCDSPKVKAYKYYGGRGISVCDKWKNDFKLFYDWAIKNGWKKGLEIDRINVNGNYEPSNCRFVSSKENNRNKRNILLNLSKALAIRTLWKYKTHTIVEMADIFGVHKSTIEYTIKNKLWV